jgi:hypothetical protein
MLEKLVEDPSNTNIVLDRGAINNHYDTCGNYEGNPNNPRSQEIVDGLSHSNNFGILHAYAPPDQRGKDYECIHFLGSDALERQYMEGFMLEASAMDFFEPNFRSQSAVRKYGLNPENPREILDDDKLDVFNQMVDDLISKDRFSLVTRTVKEYFDNDKERFRQRLTEFYDNWWPKEFQTMKGGIDKIKSWLGTLRDPKSTGR